MPTPLEAESNVLHISLADVRVIARLRRGYLDIWFNALTARESHNEGEDGR